MNAVATMSATSMTRQVAWLIFLLFLSSVYGQVSYSIPEEMAIGSFIGNVAQDLSLSLKRLNSGNARIYTTGSAEYIELDSENGVLLIKERIDRESLCGKTSPCALYFQLVLDNPMEFYQVTIEIIDINDNAPDFLKTEMTFEISESAHTAARFLLEKAVDPDIGINGLQSYKLEPTDNFLLKLHSQTDGSKNVEMILQKPLDRETRDKLTLLLTAMDGGDPPMSGTVQIYINVLDANDNAPVFSRPIYKAAVTENVSRGTVLTKVSASDLDQGSNGEIKYSISRSIDMMSNLFEIDENSGEVRLVGEMDYEKDKHYQIDIKAKDHGGLSDSCKVIIDVIDVNDNSPIINLMSKSKSVPEDSPQNTVVAIMTVQDTDSGSNGKVHCRIDENIPFSIRSTANDFYSLITGSSLDRETQSEYNITVICADEGIPSLSSSVILNLQISDVNDNVPIFEQSSYVTYVLENNTPGLSIFSVKAIDADWKQNSRVSYILEDSSVNGVPVSSYVSVNSESGVVHAVRSLDYEQIKDFQFRVKAQDGGSPPLSNNVTVKVFILDQNDNSPQILYPVHSGNSLVTELVPHSVDVGYLVTKVVAVDVDSGQNAWLSYKLLKPADRPLFEVSLQNGEIRTVRQISDKDSVRQKLTIVVEDNGKPPRSTSVSVNVAVADSFPEVLSEFNDFTYDKKYNDNLTFYLILALAVASFLFIVSIVTIISAKCYRWRRERMFYKSGGNLPVIPYYPPLYADVGGTGTLQHAYNYDTCRSTDSRMSDVKYVRPCSQSVLHVDLSGKETVTREKKDDPNIFEEVSPSCLSYFTLHSL